jgi:hypothetical protein
MAAIRAGKCHAQSWLNKGTNWSFHGIPILIPPNVAQFAVSASFN